MRKHSMKITQEYNTKYILSHERVRPEDSKIACNLQGDSNRAGSVI